MISLEGIEATMSSAAALPMSPRSLHHQGTPQIQSCQRIQVKWGGLDTTCVQGRCTGIPSSLLPQSGQNITLDKDLALSWLSKASSSSG